MFGGHEPSISFSDAIANDAIILVCGTGIIPRERTKSDGGASQTTQLLITTVIRRLWEAFQVERNEHGVYPIAIERLPEVLPANSTLLHEMLRDPSRLSTTRSAPWLTGPALETLEQPVQELLRDEIGAWFLLDVEDAPGMHRMANWLDALGDRTQPVTEEARGTVDPVEWLALSESGPLPFTPYSPYPRQHDEETAMEAIARSVRTHSCDTLTANAVPIHR